MILFTLFILFFFYIIVMNHIIIFIIIIVLSSYKLIKKICHQSEIFQFKGKDTGPTITLISGTHGNEPAGAIYLTELVKKFQKGTLYLKRGKLIIIPEVNKCGLYLNTRNVPDFPFSWDANRNYPFKSSTKETPTMILRYLHIINRSDFILDFHEGWGFHKIHPSSVGSGVYPNGYGNSTKLSKKIVKHINYTISKSDHIFIAKPLSDIKGSLKNYTQENKIPYILVETSGQNNILPLSTRKKQIDIIIKTIFQEMKLL
jgi:uncharacterized protein